MFDAQTHHAKKSPARAIKWRRTESLRKLIEIVDPELLPVSEESPASKFSILLRSANNAPVQTETPSRKYLWVRRTSRRAYNMHMSRMNEPFAEIKAVPTVLLFGSIVGIAVLLSLFIH